MNHLKCRMKNKLGKKKQWMTFHPPSIHHPSIQLLFLLKYSSLRLKILFLFLYLQTVWCRITQCVRWDKTALHLWVQTLRHTCDGKYSNASEGESSRLERMATGAGGGNWNWIFSFSMWRRPNSILSMTQLHWPGWSHTKAQRGGEKKHAYILEKAEPDKNNVRCSAVPHTNLLSPVEMHCWTCQTKLEWITFVLHYVQDRC